MEIIEKINPNACNLKLPTHVRTHNVLHVKHLILYVGDSSFDKDAVGHLRTNVFDPGGMMQCKMPFWCIEIT